MKTPANVVVHIGALELHGFPVHRRHAIADAMQRELTRLLSHDATVSTTRDDAVTSPASIDPHAPPHAVGVAIATAVHAGLRR